MPLRMPLRMPLKNRLCLNAKDVEKNMEILI